MVCRCESLKSPRAEFFVQPASGFFRHRGAYARFKELLLSEGCLDKWYAYEAEATEQALRDWCRANEIQLDETGNQQSA